MTFIHASPNVVRSPTGYRSMKPENEILETVSGNLPIQELEARLEMESRLSEDDITTEVSYL